MKGKSYMDTNVNTGQNGGITGTGIKLDVTVRPIEPKNNLLAFANVRINDCFVVEGLKVCNGKNGLFVDMPSSPDGKGGFKEVCKPVTKDFREQLVNAVLSGYDNALEKMQAKVAAADNIRKNTPDKSSIIGQVDTHKKEIAARPPAVPNAGIPNKTGEAI